MESRWTAVISPDAVSLLSYLCEVSTTEIDDTGAICPVVGSAKCCSRDVQRPDVDSGQTNSDGERVNALGIER